MFDSLNLLIGVTTVMLVLSLAVTVLTQIVLDSAQLRAGHLEQGILELLAKAGVELKRAQELVAGWHLNGATEVSAADLSKLAGTLVDGEQFQAKMAEVSTRFTTTSRLVTAGISVVLAVGLPLDTLALIRSLSVHGSAILFPETLAGWLARWHHVNLAGVALSALLLSMGAPFWFEILKDLLKLRGPQAK
jgi:hypothetical protein